MNIGVNAFSRFGQTGLGCTEIFFLVIGNASTCGHDYLAVVENDETLVDSKYAVLGQFTNVLTFILVCKIRLSKKVQRLNRLHCIDVLKE